MENPTHSFWAVNHVFQLAQELRIESKTVELAKREENAFFVTFILPKGIFLTFGFYLSA